jgi:uncharacterized protein Yka (UPF0111/DUF47 family)
MQEQSREHDSQQGKSSLRNIGSIGAAEIMRHLSGVSYPADREDLLDYATQQDVPQDVIGAIEQFPDQTYNSQVHVAQMLDRIQY